ncbi:asparagine synthase (glutamine-hydrolyzing) [Thauera humireducens]|uniref:asparagine synthase (glutamine-hydrolyzing) n=1 Tax=Thauera humireducens TaxID=1134435 RepID=UPI00311E0E01
MQRMNDVQHHRGPDEGGYHFEPGVALAHRRLSIIDLATGQQPLFNEDGSVAVVFNGEIYNFQELVPELEALGHVFHTRSDTEVIVHAWEAWGEDCVQRFRGMFAFALHDRNRDTFFMARDRLAVKPMFYALLPDGTLAFGSELKVLMQHPDLDRRIDPQAVEEYFALGYVAEPRTIFLGARKLGPGESLCIRRGQPIPRAPAVLGRALYPRQRSPLRRPPPSSPSVCASPCLRMISEVPLGAFLSGGVDSSAVVATMAGLSDEPVNTCSIAFDDPKFNESEFAQRVADRYRTNHFVETVKSDDFDLIDTLAALRRALRRQLRHPHLPGVSARAQARPRLAVGRWRR